MRKEHKPLWLLRLQKWCSALYVKRVLTPQFDALGPVPFFLHPQAVVLTGRQIHAGAHLHIIADPNKKVCLTTWSSKQLQGQIHIGDHCLISPGVQIASAVSIVIEDNCMIAAEVNIADCDWHGLYNRVRPFRCHAPVHLKANCWVGLRAVIGKGVTIGENSVVAAGTVVVNDVPDNCVVGGNPARVIKQLKPERRMLTRARLFHQQDTPEYYLDQQRALDAYLFAENSLLGWLKSRWAPDQRD